MTIHEAIRKRREALGWSHQRLADEISRLEGLQKPLAWQTVQQWEKSTAPKRTRLPIVAQALRTTVAQLMNLHPGEPVRSGHVDLDQAGLADRLRAVRVAKKFEVEEVASACGITTDQLRAIEAGEQEPSIWVLRPMALKYGYSVDALVWQDAVSPEAMRYAAAFDHLDDAKKRALETFWLTFIEPALSDDDVEREIPITAQRPNSRRIEEGAATEPPKPARTA